MAPSRFEIYDARVRLGKATYLRPCVIMDMFPDGKLGAYAISSALELFTGPTFHFRIYADEPDFAGTGLKKDSYVKADEAVILDESDLVRKRGQFEGELLSRYKKWTV